MKKERCFCSQTTTASGPGFSRRRFLKITGTGLIASWFSDVLDLRLLRAASAAAAPTRGTARNCILLFLGGAPSQIDTWDLKEGPWTPSALAPTSYGEIRFPQGLLPGMATHLGEMVLVRSGRAWAAVHSLATTWAQIARNPTGALGRIAPHIGAVVALESQIHRIASDVLPGFIALNRGTAAGSGYLSAEFAPFILSPDREGISVLSHPDGAGRLDDRWNLIAALDGNRRDGALGKATMDMADHYDQAKVLIDTPEVGALFQFSDEESQRYASSQFGNSLVIAKNLIASNRGTRFVQVTLGNWDHHANLYGENGNSLFTQCAALDPAFDALLTDLAATPGVESPRLLDETLVVILGEFGRTVGPLNNQGGRDHHLQMSIVFAGGGVRGGRAIGRTNELGDVTVEYGWGADREVRPEDVTCTIYSALGIDYTTVRNDDPLGRGFEYVPYAKEGLYQPIDELW